MKKLLLCLLLWVNPVQAQTIIAYDYIETFDWMGNWWTFNNSGFYTNAFVSSNASCAHYGLGAGSSPIEADWYVLPNVVLDPTKQYMFRFRLGSYTFSNPIAATRGVDVSDYIIVQLSTDGGMMYTNEMRITGFSNAYWDYNENAIASKIADGTQTIYTPGAGGDRTNTGDGFSIIELTLQPGTSQVAFDIYCRANANGEEWWMDNFELLELDALPVEMISFEGSSTEHGNLLIWETATEHNSDYYLIERSTTGEFNENSVIGIKQAAGNSTELLTYVFVDNDYRSEINYYRITQVDKDGNWKIYGPILIDNTYTNKQLVKVVNMLGQEVDQNTSGILFEIYEDGSSKKVFK